jgi:hypothetical protein
MNKEQHELLDEANNNYLNKCLDKKWMKENVFFDGSSNHHLYLKEEFIDKCKTDTEFSEKWGLKIEERELSLDEELEYMMGKVFSEEVLTHQVNVPTKLITITYNDKTIESYE